MIIQEIKESGCEFRVIKLKGTGKNALDFYIAAECGIISYFSAVFAIEDY